MLFILENCFFTIHFYYDRNERICQIMVTFLEIILFSDELMLFGTINWALR